MKKLLALSAIGVAVLFATGCQTTGATATTTSASPLATTATSYKNERFMKVDSVSYPIAETSARILVGTDGKPLLVNDIFDGKGDKVVPGYRIMVMNRTTSLAAEGRKMPDGKIIDNRMVHRGSKSRIGIPVVNGKAVLEQAVLLDLDIIADEPNKALAEGETFKPRGKKITKNDVPVNDKQVVVRSFTIPNLNSGENAGGGIDFTATATIEGQKVSTGANSAFQLFEGGTDESKF